MNIKIFIPCVFLFLILIFPNIGVAEEEKFVYDDHNKRDPFWKLVNPSGAIMNYESDILLSDMVLEGIIAGEFENVAIINGVIVRPQDKFGLFTIERIEKDKVFLSKGPESFVLNLKKEE